jgi:hypothetical protein
MDLHSKLESSQSKIQSGPALMAINLTLTRYVGAHRYHMTMINSADPQPGFLRDRRDAGWQLVQTGNALLDYRRPPSSSM